MAITPSTLQKFAIDLNDGGGVHVFSPQPTGMTLSRMADAEINTDGTENTPMYWNMTLTFSLMRKDQAAILTDLWRPSKQRVKLNYMSGRNPGMGGSTTNPSGWYWGNGVWRDPPLSQVEQIRGIIVYNMTITIYRLEWDGAAP